MVFEYNKARVRTVVIVADMDELLLDIQEDLVEAGDGVLLGRVGGAQVDGLCGSLRKTRWLVHVRMRLVR